jgi:hypothetical protein
MATPTKHTEVMKLIVKAPNQLIEDQNVDCDLTWTVLNLKEHLSHVYPSKPVSKYDIADLYAGTVHIT